MTEEIKRGRRVTADVTKAADGAEDTITKSELDLLKASAAKATELETELEAIKSAATELDALKSALGGLDVQDLLKASMELKDLKKAQEEKVLTDTVEVVKGFNLFEEEKVEDVAKFFVANAGEEVNLILASLEKARTAIEEFGEVEHGSDLTNTTDVAKSEAQVKEMGNAVLDIIKARKKS